MFDTCAHKPFLFWGGGVAGFQLRYLPPSPPAQPRLMLISFFVIFLISEKLQQKAGEETEGLPLREREGAIHVTNINLVCRGEWVR